MDVQCLSAAFDALKENDIAIGPAVDGGYYLIALSKPVPELFTDVNWGTEAVFDTTIKIAKSHGLRLFQLKKVMDAGKHKY